MLVQGSEAVTPEALQALREGYARDKDALLAHFRDPDIGYRRMRGVLGTLKKLTQLTDAVLLALWRLHGLDRDRAALVAVGGYGRSEMFPHSDVDVLVLLPDPVASQRNPVEEAGVSAKSGAPATAAVAPSSEPESRPLDPVQSRISAFIGSCWDLGLQIGSSVRTVSDCLNESAGDITVQTSLLERRLISGPPALYQQLSAAYDSAMQPYAFYLAKTLEMRQRHAKFDNTPYSLEPNCKESPGGLRDLHIVLWVAKAAGYGTTWDALTRNGLMTRYEAKQIKRNYTLLSLIRARLHLVANRREDRLVFDLQTLVAEQFGYTAIPRQTRQGHDRSPIRPSEALMRHYYWTAKAVTQLSQILLLNIAERLRDSGHTRNYDPAPVTRAMRALQARTEKQAQPSQEAGAQLAAQEVVNPVASTATPQTDYLAMGGQRRAMQPINERFLDNNGLLEVVSDTLYREQPHAILETFLVLQRTVGIKGLSARTLRALFNARVLMDSKFRRDPVNREQFLQILQAPSGVTSALRLMNQTSVLGRYLWVFRKIVGQMQHDLFHVYTVDQHILMVVRNVRRFFKVEHAHEYPLCSQLAAGWDSPWILSTAALFHDIAKGRGGDHSQLGEREIRRFAKNHGIGKADTALLAFLVREHLTMSTIAQKQDLSDPEVILAFARTVRNERYLTALYLLTVADIRGTSPKVWNGWKGKLLEDLYQATLRVLGGHHPDQDSLVESHKRGALVEMARFSMPFEGHVKLWNALDVGYFVRHDSGDIAWHTRHIARYAGQGKTVVRARLAPHGEGLQVLVYCPDQPELFARICGYFEQAAFSILDAKIHTTSDGYALDTFQVVTSLMPEHYREFITMVETSLARALEQHGPLPEPARGRVSRRVRIFPITPAVQLSADEKAQHWVLTITTSDRLGLLYRIARVLSLHQISVELAKISTMGERVEDTFLIESPSLASPRFQAELERDLLDAIAIH